MDKKKIVKPAILLVTILIFSLMFYIFSLNAKLEYKQKALNETCLSMLHEVQFAYKYDNLDEPEIRALQAVDLNNLKNTQLMIYHTSWCEKDKINEMVVSLSSYYAGIYLEGEVIEASKAAEIQEHYIGVLINIDNEYCEAEIDSILKLLEEEELKNMQ